MNVIVMWCVYNELLEDLLAFVMTFFMKHGDGGKCFFFGTFVYHLKLVDMSVLGDAL
jgi:hypothetical protein